MVSQNYKSMKIITYLNCKDYGFSSYNHFAELCEEYSITEIENISRYSVWFIKQTYTGYWECEVFVND